MTELVDTIVSWLTTQGNGYTFTVGSPYSGNDYTKLRTNHVLFTKWPDPDGSNEWELTFNYFHDAATDGLTLAGYLKAYSAVATTGVPIAMYKGVLPGTTKHFTTIKQLFWEN